MKIRTYLTGVFFVVCLLAEGYAFVAKTCEIPEHWSAMETKQKNAAVAGFDLDAKSINLGKPFSFKVAICGKNDIKPDRVTATAIMPAHQHGMNYKPTITFSEQSGSYEVANFLFHMPGKWEITVSSYQGEQVTHYTKMVTIN